ncbi:hypothetical protein D9M71_700800 [compost metagenome]
MAQGANTTPTNLSGFRAQTDVEQKDFAQQQLLAALADRQYARAATEAPNIAITLNIDPITLSNLNIQEQANDLAQQFALNLEQVLVNFPQKE